MKTIIAGSRTVTYNDVITALLNCDFTDKISEIVSGTANGADKHGETIAKEYDIPIKQFPAQWDKFGKSAGYKRNEEMANYADACICIWDGVSKGTQHMINIAKIKNIELFVYNTLTNQFSKFPKQI